MLNYKKYKRVPVVDLADREWPGKEIEKAPIWCSVDLRDGNQALIEPMVVEEKIEFFNMLVKLGFKEIEVGFPAASQIEYDFLRQLVDRDLIPDDVTVQVLVQCREHLIERTFQALEGIKRAIVHIYNSTSTLQREAVFHKSREEIKQIAIDGTKMVKSYVENFPGEIILEYSPESFTGTELDYALEVCTAVQKEWGASKEKKIIFNLPATVEMNTPNVYADQIEWMHKHFENRESIILSVHPHNDRGTGVAAAELAMLAGADRVEGTLFGNGERTGNVDIITLAMNLFSHGVNPQLDFSNMSEISKTYERLTRMKVSPRQPYAGELVFTAFSGSHQDAIAKGMAYREEKKEERWTVPYLPIDPKDVGRTYDKDVIRINSQSGKGGISYVLKEKYSMTLPDAMKESVGYMIKDVSDKGHKELEPEEIYQIFEDKYIHNMPVFQIVECHFKQTDGIVAEAAINYNNEVTRVKANGNGRLDAVSNVIKQFFGISYELSVYEEHSLERGSSSKAVAYVGILHEGKRFWGVGIDEDIIGASIHALTVAVNQLDCIKSKNLDARMNEILNFIQENYTSVTLEDLSGHFHLSKPYMSKYIKEKSGETFGDIVKNIRMKKAKTLLKNTSMTVENVSRTLGYDNVEHFSRSFKKTFQMTPMQYRNIR